MKEMQQAGAAADPATMMSLAGQMLPFQALSILIALVTSAIMLGATARAGLGREGGLGYLAFGKDEFRLMVIALVIGLILFVCWIVTSMLATVGVATSGPDALKAMQGASPMPRDAMIKACLFGLPGFLLLVFLGVKLSLAHAQTVGEQSIRIFGSWALTKGNFWRLLGAYLLAAIPVIIIAVVAAGVNLAMRGSGFDGDIMQNMKSLQAASTSMEALFSPAGLVGMALGAVINTLVMAAAFTTAASAYARLAPPPHAAADDDEGED
jgi:hypothetical protein